jgi:cobalt/nickel transport system permease protein
MHLPDTILPLSTCFVTGLISAPAVGYAMVQVRRSLGERAAPLMGVVAACVFAIQMLNFPLPFAPVSGHFMGSVLAAALVGPWGGVLVLAAVLVVQALLFQDGGILALGANIVNLAVVGCLVGYAVLNLVRRQWQGTPGLVGGAVLGAWMAILLGAVACSVELATSPDIFLPAVLGPMLLWHSLIGLAEAVVTGLALSYLAGLRPDLIYDGSCSRVASRMAEVVAVGLAAAVLLAVCVAPFASPLPDALEATLAAVGVEPATEAVVPAPLPDYQVQSIQNTLVGGAIAGLVGTVITFIVGFVLGVRAGKRRPATPHW